MPSARTARVPSGWRHKPLQAEPAAEGKPESGDGEAASGVQHFEERPLGRNGGARLGVIEPGKKPRGPAVSAARGDGERTLPRRREPAADLEVFRDPPGPPHAPHAGCRQHDGVELAGVDLGDPRVQVSAQIDHLEIRTERPQERGPPKRARPDSRAGRN